MKKAALILLLLTAPAKAQWSTNCTTIGQHTNCRTNGPPPPYQAPAIRQFDVAPLLQLNEELRRRREERESLEASQFNRAEEEAARSAGVPTSEMTPELQYAIALMRAGRCDDLYNFTLEKVGKSEADEARKICKQ